MDIRHKNPLMSVSLSEYWGLRWNPVVCKLLQGAFYKPLRRAGASQIACVLACFAGSAALHALPVYMGTFDGPETVMMGFFFLGNGLLVLFEQVFAALVGWADKQGKSRPRAEAAANAAAAPASPVRPAAGAGAPAGAVTEPRPSDPRASSRVMSNVPYVGELFLLSGVCGLFYAGAAAGGPVAALTTHTGTVAASLGLLAVAMGCVWYTQWVFGKFDAEVGVVWGVGRRAWIRCIASRCRHRPNHHPIVIHSLPSRPALSALHFNPSVCPWCGRSPSRWRKPHCGRRKNPRPRGAAARCPRRLATRRWG